MKESPQPTILSILLFLFGLLLNAPLTAANPIYPITHEWHDPEYYADQARQWEPIAKTDACNTMAWYHYYLAAHFANFFGEEKTFELDAIRAAAEQQLTEADFALHYIRCRHEHDSEARWRHIFAAHAAEPDRPEAYEGIATYHLVHGDLPEMRKYLEKHQTAQPFPMGIMTWNFNQLNSVGQDGILITFGDNDTYASLVLQQVYGIRADVQVVNMALFNFFPTYQERICKKLGISPPKGTKDNPAQAALEAILGAQNDVYLGVGAPQELIDANAEQLYLTGLAFQYSNQPLNNLGQLVDNFQNKWRLEELKNPLDTPARRRTSRELSRNYLPAFFELYDHFKNRDAQTAEQLEKLIYRIAAENGMERSIEAYFSPAPPQLASQESGLKAKQILKNTAFIPAGTYYDYTGQGLAAKWPNQEAYQAEPLRTVSINSFHLQITEVSNADYQRFLEDLLRQHQFEYLDTASIADFDYRSVLPDSLKSLPANQLYRQGNEHLANYPVTNISQRAAELYAIWLTQVYNQDPKRKDGRNVRFRLPHLDEIAYASRGGLKAAPFAWGGFGVTNAKGCYLGNFNTLLAEHPDNPSLQRQDYLSPAYLDRYEQGLEAECGTNDGGYLTVKVDSYHPNNFGLYNLTGNAAEMTSESGIDTGGSWYDHVADLEIGRRKKRALPHPAVGFRLVMEYVD